MQGPRMHSSAPGLSQHALLPPPLHMLHTHKSAIDSWWRDQHPTPSPPPSSVGGVSLAASDGPSPSCACREGRHPVHAGPVRLSGLPAQLQVSGQPQVQRVLSQSCHGGQQPRRHSVLVENKPPGPDNPPPQTCVMLVFMSSLERRQPGLCLVNSKAYFCSLFE